MTCKCGSTRIILMSSKTSDRNYFRYQQHEHEGYVPGGLKVGAGDYLEFSYCADCGTIQNFSPIPEHVLVETFKLEG